MGISDATGTLGDAPIDVQVNEKVTGVEKIPADLEGTLPVHTEVYDTTHNATALTEGRDDPILDALSAYMEGTPIIVAWFTQISSNADNASNYTPLSFMSDSVNSSYLQINKMEVKLQEEFSFSYDNTENTSSVTGNCLVYPGFTPKLGDLFSYYLEPGKMGLFKVSDTPERLSIKTRTSHSVPFTLIKILDTNEYQELISRVREIAYFDKQRFLSENSALLTHQEVIDLEYIDKTITHLLIEYGELFYSSDCSSVFRDDGVYDPYLVEFIHRTNGIYFGKKYIVQLSPHTSNDYWNRSLFSKLLHRDNISDLINTCSQNIVTYSGYSDVITSLLNKDIIKLTPDGTETHIVSNILSMNINDYTGFDRVVTLFLEYGVISYSVLKDEADTIRNKSASIIFYQLPILVYLLKLLKDSIKTGNKIQYVMEDINPYTTIEFTNTDMELVEVVGALTSATLTIDPNGGKILGILDDNGVVNYLDTSDIVYNGSDTIINMLVIMDSNAILSIPGTWKVVLTNSLFI